ncbi:MAG: hypothetical protein ACE5J3_12055, partial [Methanosarcinales archaeon]
VLLAYLSSVSNKNHYYSTVTSGLITKKEISREYEYSIIFKRFCDTKDKIIEVKIIVDNENVWNLIEENRYYFLTYYQKNNETPVLGQIEHNDEFGEIYGEYFNESRRIYHESLNFNYKCQ